MSLQGHSLPWISVVDLQYLNKHALQNVECLYIPHADAYNSKTVNFLIASLLAR